MDVPQGSSNVSLFDCLSLGVTPPVATEPVTLVIFGGAGDLAHRKLLPALYNLHVDGLLPPGVFRRENVPWEAAFLAGKAFVAYRKAGGERSSPLPDFFIGAHAAIRGYDLLTRDPRGFRKYFPTLRIISPETHP